MAFQTLFRDNITIKRATPEGGYLDSNFNWVPAPTTDVFMKGNIMAYKATDVVDGNVTKLMSYGFESQDIKRVLTDAEVLVANRKTQQEPDKIDIEGTSFVCWRVYDYLDQPLTTLRHCDCVFVREDKLAAMEVGSGN